MELSDFRISDAHEVSLTFKLTGDDWAQWLRQASRELQSQRPLPGYRAGKAPVSAACRFYGKQLLERSAQLALPEALEEICQQKDVSPVTQPVFTMVDPTLESLTACCDFITYPQVKELTWKGLQVNRYIKTCTDAHVDEAQQRFMRQRLEVKPVTRTARMDDIVEVSFRGTHQGGPFYYDHSDNSRFRLGSEQLFAGLDEALVGVQPGEKISVQLTMPQDFHREEIRGLTLDLQVQLLGVWSRELRVCDDAFVKEFVKGCETVEEFRQQLRQQVQTRFDRESDRIYQQNLSSAIAATVTCPIPDAMVRVALDGMIRALAPAAAQKHMTVPQLLASEGRTMEEYVRQCRPIAENKVRRSIALDYVIREEKLTITPEEYSRYLTACAGDKSLAQTEQMLGGKEEILLQMLNDRARDRIAAHAEEIRIHVEEFPQGGDLSR